MNTDELRAKFEAWWKENYWYVDENLSSLKHYAWMGWLAAYASRDAEVEALRKDAERWRSLVAENNKGRHGKFRICWLDSSREGFITTDGVSRDGKDEEAVVRIFDAAMRNGA